MVFSSQVMEHIENIISLDGYETNSDNPIQSVFNIFIAESSHIKNGSNYNLFKEWLKGLPSSMNIHFTDHDIYNQLKQWFENCGETYDESKYDSELYFHLITREFFKMLNS